MSGAVASPNSNRPKVDPERPTVMEAALSKAGANQRGDSGRLTTTGRPPRPLTESGDSLRKSKHCALAQPWRRFWPPTDGSDAYRRLENEHPDVLTCRFDITRPFNRPWRLWTGPAPLEGGGCSLDPNEVAREFQVAKYLA
jgi:hypothetical protein